VLISAFESAYAIPLQNFSMGARSGKMPGTGFNQQTAFMPQNGMSSAGVGGALALFGKREAVAEQNALLRETQMQIEMINSNPEAKLAYLRSMRQGLGAKAEFARVMGLPVGKRADALEALYAKLRAENQGLMWRQHSMSGRLSMPGMPSFNKQQVNGSDDDSAEASMNDIALYYKQQRGNETSSTSEVGPNDYIVNMRLIRASMGGSTEVGPNDVRSFMQTRR